MRNHRPSRFLTATAPLLLVTGLGLTALPDSAHAGGPTLRAIGEIRPDIAPDMCLDATGGPVETGDNAYIWSCVGQDQQFWYLTMDGEIRSAMDPNKCLDVSGANNANGTNVHMWDCNGSVAQRWTLGDDGLLRSAVGENKCLDVQDFGTSNGSNVQIWDCHGDANQRWSTTLLPWDRVRSMLDYNKCLDVSSVTDVIGANVHLSDCHDQLNQQWMLTPAGEVRSAVAANRCLDNTGIFATGQPVIYWYCNGTDAQRWELTPSGELRSAANPNFCLDVAGGNTTNGTDVRLWDCNGTNAQRWASSGFIQIELRPIDGVYALVFRSGGEGQAIVDPRTILQLMYRLGYDHTSIQQVIGELSPNQLYALENHYLPQYPGLDELLTGPIGASQIAYDVQIDGPGLDARFAADPNMIDARLGIDLIDVVGDGWGGSISGPSAVAYVYLGHDGVAINTGVDVISVDFYLGDPNGSFVGVGAGAGIGLDAGAKWGQDDQYGVTFGIKAITVKAYVSGEDATNAYNDTKGAIENDAIPAITNVANDAIAWCDQAAADSEGWVNQTSKEAEGWITQSADAVGDWFNQSSNHALHWFTNLFG